MNKNDMRKALYSQLYVMKAQLETIVFMIEEIEKSEEEEFQKCPHPAREKISYNTMGGPEHWKCGICGYEYIEVLNVKEKGGDD